MQLDTGQGQLWDAQECALGALSIFGGVAMQAGCGDGKTLTSILGATVCSAQRPLLLIPGKLRADFDKQWRAYQAAGFRLPTNLVIKAHDFISRNSTWLESYRPDYIFIDEAHRYRRPESARTRRLLRYLEANPTVPNGGSVVFGVASGTLAATSIMDFAHLLTHSLGPRCPVPRRFGQDISGELARWANCLDVKGRPGALDWHNMRRLVELFAPEWIDTFNEGTGVEKRHCLRQAYDSRRRSVPGLICSDSESVEASLVVYTSPKPEPPPEIVSALRMAKNGYSPDGDEAFDEPDKIWRALQQISIGVFYRWAWERTELGRRDEEWIDARKKWNRAVLRELQERAAPNYDSPGEIAAAVEADIVATYRDNCAPQLGHLHRAYVAWYKLRKRYNVDDLVEHVWISDWYCRHVYNEAMKAPRPVIVWWESTAMADGLRALGMPVFGAGSAEPPTAITCAMSRRRFGEGANLQDRWSDCHYAELPPSGEQVEQSLARLHRAHQIRDNVTARVYTHTAPFVRNLAQACEKAAFIEPMQGRQRLTFVPIVPLDG